MSLSCDVYFGRQATTQVVTLYWISIYIFIIFNLISCCATASLALTIFNEIDYVSLNMVFICNFFILTALWLWIYNSWQWNRCNGMKETKKMLWIKSQINLSFCAYNIKLPFARFFPEFISVFLFCFMHVVRCCSKQKKLQKHWFKLKIGANKKIIQQNQD